MTTLKRQVARVFKPLLRPARYKAAHGGRGSGKSNYFAEEAVIRCIQTPGSRIVCIREIQRTLSQSVKKLIEDKIEALGVGALFEIQEAQIKTPGGGLIIFQGMQNHTADSVKSFEGFSVAYVEEAQSLSQRSLDLLRPTIRLEGSEIWFAWNPRHDTDPVDLFFRGGRSLADAVVVEANWRDNPWFPSVLKQEMLDDYEHDPEKASHVWGGGYELVGEGAYLARWVADAERDGRIGDFSYDEKLPVKTSWDLGVDDYTAIWFFQEHVRDSRPRIRVIDYYETSGDGAQMIVETAIHAKPYRYAMHYFPHDVMMREWGAGARSRYQTLIGLGVKPINVGVNLGKDAAEERIAASRAMIPICEFDDSPAVRTGLRRLRGYRRKFNDALGQYVGVLKDGNDHGADAFGEYAVNSPLVRASAARARTGPADYVPASRAISNENLGRV